MSNVFFNGPAGRLEGWHYTAQDPCAPLAMVLHQEAHLGGSMNEPIISCLYRLFVKKGFSVLRFNFRGTGSSQGEPEGGPGELADAAAALDWLQSQHPYSEESWVAGFSFGAWISMQVLMRRPEVERFIAISLPASLHDFTFLAPCPAPGLIIHGEKDAWIPQASVTKLVARLSIRKNLELDYRVIAGADHRFSNQLPQLMAQVNAYFNQNI